MRANHSTFYQNGMIDRTRRLRIDKREWTGLMEPRKMDEHHTKGHAVRYDGQEER